MAFETNEGDGRMAQGGVFFHGLYPVDPYYSMDHRLLGPLTDSIG